MKIIVALIPFLCLVSGQSRVAKDDGSKSANIVLPGFGEVNIKNLTDLFSLPNVTLPPVFSQVPCVSTVSARVGTCMKSGDCDAAHGLSDGPCALGLGVCCTKAFSTCGSSILGNVSIISNTGYPVASKKDESCEYTIFKLPAVSQIRLDFEDFDIAGVDDEGKCSQDSLAIEGANSGFKVPTICGMNKGQHMYIPVDKTALLGQLKLKFSFSSAADRVYKIRVTQLGLDHPVQAPAGCLQYFTAQDGTVSSFNYEHNKQVGIQTIKGLNYAVCFRQNKGVCSLRIDPVFTRSRRSIPYQSVPAPVYSRGYNPYYHHQPNHYNQVPASYNHNYNYYPKVEKVEPKKEDKVELVKDLLEEKRKLIAELFSGRKVDKTELIKELIDTKKEIISDLLNELLTGSQEKALNLFNKLFELKKNYNDGLIIPGIPAVLPVLPKVVPVVTPLTDSDLKKVLVPGQEETKAVSEVVAPDFDICQGRDSIGIPPSTVICDQNARSVTISEAPFAVFVDTRGTIPSRGFQFTFTQLNC